MEYHILPITDRPGWAWIATYSCGHIKIREISMARASFWRLWRVLVADGAIVYGVAELVYR